LTIESENKMDVVTWFEVQRDEKGNTVLNAFAGAKLVEQVRSSDKQKLIALMQKYPTAASVLVAPQGKAIPQIGQPALSVNKDLFLFYSKESNYNKVYSDVLKFYEAGTSNGCVAFMSEALREVGFAVPIENDSLGENISLVTKPFSEFLESKGWQRIAHAQLQPGDVCFTTDAPSYPGYPAHTYMFHSWNDQSRGLANVVDNQAFTHIRNIFVGGGGFNFSPFAYALRAV
jgi:hypothetical protein